MAREDRIAAPQMKRLVSLQRGLLESWELLPEEYRPLLDEDVFSIVGEVEGAARLARRRSALRRHLESIDRREISRRIEGPGEGPGGARRGLAAQGAVCERSSRAARGASLGRRHPPRASA